MQGPIDLTLAASAARTADPTLTPTEFIDRGVRGIIVIVDTTAAATGSVTVSIEGQDPASLKWYTILASAAIVATGTVVLAAYPGANPVANSRADIQLPRKFRVKAVHNNANSQTYSIGCTLLPG